MQLILFSFDVQKQPPNYSYYFGELIMHMAFITVHLIKDLNSHFVNHIAIVIQAYIYTIELPKPPRNVIHQAR